MAREITLRSPLRSQLTLWKKLSQAKYRHEEGLFLAEGYKVVQGLLDSEWKTRAILVLEKKSPHWHAFLSAIPQTIDVYGLSEREWDALSQDKEPEGVMAVVAMPAPTDINTMLADGSGHILLLYQIGNPNNLGAVLRAAQWFGIETIILSTDSADFTNPKVVRSSMGTLFHMRVIQDVNFAETLSIIKEHFFLVASHVRRGIVPHACKQKTAILLGSESHGLPEDLIRLSDELWHIPGAGRGNSLSLPQAAAIMMYECAAPNK
ncbi:MAG: TrmH family RNA methyltransferase [Syntrophales bacterium]|jgi:RNA methyltransferase, TrmH family